MSSICTVHFDNGEIISNIVYDGELYKSYLLVQPSGVVDSTVGQFRNFLYTHTEFLWSKDIPPGYLKILSCLSVNKKCSKVNRRL